jgi:hypothetical protein
MIMRYSRIAKVAVLLPAIAMAFGCTDLALEPHASVSNDAYFQSIGDFRAAIIGVYNDMQDYGWYGRSYPIMADVMGEDVKQNGSANRYQTYSDFEGEAVTDHGYEVRLWDDVYEGINMLNMMLNADFEPPSGVQAEFNEIMGEAYALRGLAYFNLVNIYAQHYTFTADASHMGVPIVLASDITQLPSRSTVKEVYDQIITDLTQGISMMNQVRDGSYMMTKEGAEAILSRVYLYKEDWANAAAMADAVINSGRFSLIQGEDSYVNQFANGASSEAIFEINYSNTDNEGSDYLGGMYNASGYGDYLPAKDLLDLIDPNDIRINMFAPDPKLVGKYCCMRVNKWPSWTASIPVIRESEVYLNRAEARAQMGQDAGAQADLNKIRERGLATAAPVTATGQALLDQIEIERRIELGYEGHRIFDLMRHKEDIVRVDYTGDVGFEPYPCQFCILPIPQVETDANPNIKQNPGF